MTPKRSDTSAPRPATTRSYDLVAFDVDGTLIGHAEGKVIWELFNGFFGGDETVNHSRYAAYRAGEISYAQWVELDVSDWIRVRARRDQMVELIEAQLAPVLGATETLQRLVRRGYRLAVISGTLDLTLELLFPAHPFEVVCTNKLFFDPTGLVSGWEATPYDMEGKAEALVRIAGEMAIPLERTVFVGDNINDVYVMERAGLAIAFEPKKESVRSAADHVVVGDLRGVAELLGA